MSPVRPLLLFFVSLFFFAAVCFAENPIQLENDKPGTPDWGLANEALNHEVEGYASATSVNRGDSIRIFVNTVDPSYTLEIFRMGWYGGAGARRVVGPVTRSGIRQTIPTPDPQTGLVECNWTDPYVVTIGASSDPTEWCSGFYLVRLTGSSGKQKYVMFVVRDDSRHSNHYFQSCVTTMEAYNFWGGKSLYKGSPQAVKVSFNRPYDGGGGTGDFLWQWEYNMVRFLEREGDDVTYSTDVDTAERGDLLLNHKSFLSVGHDEYWSAAMRSHVEAARDAGVNLGFFSGNDCYWQIRFEPSTVDSAADRTIVAYKESALKADPYATDSDASNDIYVTTSWRSAPVNNPEASMIGVQYIYNPVKPPGDIVIDDVTSAPWVFEAAGVTSGTRLTGLLGYEVDAIASASPADVVRLGHSPFQDTSVTPSQTRYSDMTLYTAASGAMVFAAGSIQWAWGVDDWNERATGVAPVPAAQQITRNLLRRFAGSTAVNDCQFTLSPPSSALGSFAGSGSISVQTDIGCSWTAASNAAWLTVTDPSTAVSGSGSVNFTWNANSGPARQAVITVVDRTATAVQDDGCTISIAPSQSSQPAAGGSGSISVTASSDQCSWSAVPGDAWVTITAGSSGKGSGQVAFTVAENSGAQRSTAIDIAKETFSIDQASGCTYTASPMSIAAPKQGQAGTVAITTDSTCYWSASSDVSWITITAGANGQGNGTVSYSIAVNDGADRSGTISAAGQKVTVSESGVPCSYSVSPEQATVAPAAGTVSVALTAPRGCAWTTSSNSPWLSVSPRSGSGSTTVTVSIAANPSVSARDGSAAIAGQLFAVHQNGTAAAFTATATGSASSITINWSAVSGAVTYRVGRSTGTGPFAVIASTSSSPYIDSQLPGGTAYVYQVRAVDGSGTTVATSNSDPATTVAFIDDPIAAGSTVIKAAHLTQLRAAINDLRHAAALGAFAYSNTIAPGSPVRAADFLEMRTAIDEAYKAIGLPAVAWDAAIQTGATIRATQLQQLRTAVH